MEIGTLRGISIVGSVLIMVAAISILHVFGLIATIVYFFIAGLVWTTILRGLFKCPDCKGRYYDFGHIPTTKKGGCLSCGSESEPVASDNSPVMVSIGLLVSLLPLAYTAIYSFVVK